uniref:Metalloenzyme domain-containing protein n=1 Tax=Palpitomonas bilix TaxID=652834 RepID=A0A7S3GE96_9EUKA
MDKKGVLFILIDGVGDSSCRSQDRRTPMQVAHTPNMDALARGGETGMIDPVEPGYACGSDTAHLSLFGYPPKEYYRGRGSFESMGAGMEMEEGDVAFKSNFAYIDTRTRVVEKRRADRNFEVEGPILCSALDGIAIPGYPEVEVAVKYATEHRCGVRIRCPNMVDTITGTDPLRDSLPLVKCLPTTSMNDGKSIYACKVVEAVSAEFEKVLSAHPLNKKREEEGKNPANVVLLRGPGARLRVEPFTTRYGWKGAMIAPTAIIAGIGITIGMDVFKPEGTTGDYSSDYSKKGDAAVQLLTKGRDASLYPFTSSGQDEKEGGNEGRYDFCFLHIKGVDDAGHDGSFELKVALLEKVDKMVGDVVKRLSVDQTRDYVCAITGDHSTPVFRLDHSSEPVPFVLAESVRRVQMEMGGKSEVEGGEDPSLSPPPTFDEIGCAGGRLGRFGGGHVMSLLLQCSSTKEERAEAK